MANLAASGHVKAYAEHPPARNQCVLSPSRRHAVRAIASRNILTPDACTPTHVTRLSSRLWQDEPARLHDNLVMS